MADIGEGRRASRRSDANDASLDPGDSASVDPSDSVPTGTDRSPAGAEPGGNAGRSEPDVDPRRGDDEPGPDRLSATVVALTADEIEPATRRQLLGRLVGQTRARGVRDLFKPRSAVRWMVDTVAEIAPHVPIRDLATLRRHFPGLDDEEIADRLVRNASRSTAGIGAAGGGASAVQWTIAPTLLSAPVLLAAETVAVVAVELKLVGELHEIYRAPLPAGGTGRTAALVQAWASQRGVNPMMPGVGVGAVLGTAARRELSETLIKRFGRNLTTLGPFLTGAAVASYLNRRATRSLADQLRTDLRRQRRALPDTPPALPDTPPALPGAP